MVGCGNGTSKVYFDPEKSNKWVFRCKYCGRPSFRFHYQPLFENGARVPSLNSRGGIMSGLKWALDIKPSLCPSYVLSHMMAKVVNVCSVLFCFLFLFFAILVLLSFKYCFFFICEGELNYVLEKWKERWRRRRCPWRIKLLHVSLSWVIPVLLDFEL